jgi:hypothetical protein
VNIPQRYRLPIAILASLAVVALVFLAVALLGNRVPVPSSGPTSSPSASNTDDPTADPESVVRAFFEAFGRARRTDDATLVLPFVTSDRADAYLSVSAFLDGQREVGKASVLTVQELSNMTVETDDSTATVEFEYVEGGYDIDLDTGEPLESPEVLPPFHVTVSVTKVDSRWLVDSYTSRQ